MGIPIWSTLISTSIFIIIWQNYTNPTQNSYRFRGTKSVSITCLILDLVQVLVALPYNEFAAGVCKSLENPQSRWFSNSNIDWGNFLDEFRWGKKKGQKMYPLFKKKNDKILSNQTWNCKGKWRKNWRPREKRQQRNYKEKEMKDLILCLIHNLWLAKQRDIKDRRRWRWRSKWQKVRWYNKMKSCSFTSANILLLITLKGYFSISFSKKSFKFQKGLLKIQENEDEYG